MISITVSANLKGALLMVAAMGAFRVTDAAMKIALETVPMGQVIFLRALPSLAILFAIAVTTGAFHLPPRSERTTIALVGVCEMTGNWFFLGALALLPLSAVVAVLQVHPLLLAAAGALFFGEAMGWRRWTAIFVGFAGVMLIIRPGADILAGGTLLVLGAVLCIAGRDLASRQISKSVSSLVVALVTSVVVLGFGAALGLSEVWVWPAPRILLVLLISGIAISIGYVAAVAAIRMGEVGFVAPFRYTAILWGGVLGFVVFGEVPDALALAGAVIVVAAGLFVLMREHTATR